MRRVIDGVAYDTDKAELVASGSHDSEWSQAFWSLYRNRAGVYFEVAAGHDGVVESWIPLNDQEAQEWLEKHANHLVEQYFGLMPEAGTVSSPLSVEKRRLVLASTKTLKALGHSGYESMLLEFGVPEDVGTGSGLLARANSLGRYVLSNPDARAYDGSLLSDALLKRAKAVYDRGQSNNVTDDEWREFEQASAQYSAFTDSATFAADLVARKSVLDQALAAAAPSSTKSLASERPKARRKVFIVHGHDTARARPWLGSWSDSISNR